MRLTPCFRDDHLQKTYKGAPQEIHTQENHLHVELLELLSGGRNTTLPFLPGGKGKCGQVQSSWTASKEKWTAKQQQQKNACHPNIFETPQKHKNIPQFFFRLSKKKFKSLNFFLETPKKNVKHPQKN